MKITDIASCVDLGARRDINRKRPGEKLHEQMIGFEDAEFTYEYNDYFKILPNIFFFFVDKERIKDGKKVAPDFIYASDNNAEWMSQEDLRAWIESNYSKIGQI